MNKKVVLDVCAILDAYGIQKERWDDYIQQFSMNEPQAFEASCRLDGDCGSSPDEAALSGPPRSRRRG